MAESLIWNSKDRVYNPDALHFCEGLSCQSLYGPSRAIHGMLSWAPSKRVFSYLRTEMIPVGSEISNATGVIKTLFYSLFHNKYIIVIYNSNYWLQSYKELMLDSTQTKW